MEVEDNNNAAMLEDDLFDIVDDSIEESKDSHPCGQHHDDEDGLSRVSIECNNGQFQITAFADETFDFELRGKPLWRVQTNAQKAIDFVVAGFLKLDPIEQMAAYLKIQEHLEDGIIEEMAITDQAMLED